MNNSLGFRVFPREAKVLPYQDKVTLTESERKNIQGLTLGNGIILWIVINIIVGFVEYAVFQQYIGIAVLIPFVAVFLIHFLIKKTKIADLEKNLTDKAQKKADEANKLALSQPQRNAQSLTSTLIQNYQSSINLVDVASDSLEQASLFLQKAEEEYKANAFAPFWDAVEWAAHWLGDYNYRVTQISTNADEYYRLLKGQQHTFPVFPVKLQNIPDASFVADELYRITRLGQTNFHFANIWEHRRTRKEIVKGFRTLSEAIDYLGVTIENSISNLQSSISSDLAKVVEEQIRTRESIDRTHQSVDKAGKSIDKRLLEQNRMLDNIQHNREPKLKDIPSKY